ncbi:MAG TPA: response regulator [Nitrospiraceae bacterium]|nr:response regulator [Nitrospiraceae bacterium]
MSSTPSYFPQAQSPSCSNDPLILVVDDDQAVRNLTSSMLELKGYAVLCASSGEEAVKLFEEFGPRIKLLVIDIVMPTMSGPIIAQRLRELRPELPILFVSGLIKPSHFQGLTEEWFLRKPYTQRLLLNKIRELLPPSS